MNIMFTKKDVSCSLIMSVQTYSEAEKMLVETVKDPENWKGTSLDDDYDERSEHEEYEYD